MEINKCYRFWFTHSVRLLLVSLISFTSFNSLAFFELDALEKTNELGKKKVEYYQNDNLTNQVPYFDNRFRLDANLEEITLIFYRKSGSTPIILIRPDGSKIRVNQFDHKKVQWFDDSTFDMINIKNPMPGPWQAVGDILPNSQIFVVSDVKIVVDPLPEIAFSGETLKVEGKLFNGEEAINSPNFRNVVKLDINFYSTNDSQYENFGADAIKVSSFRDDGRGLDEYANDNTFTGEFILDFAAGEWQPVYLVKLPMATRELRQKSILLQKTPVALSVIKSEDNNKPHQLNLTIDPSFVDPDSLVFQGKFTFPDRQVEPFSIMDATGETRSVEIENTEPGIYRVNVSAFGKTKSGREFRLVVPEYTFNAEAPIEAIDPISGELLEVNTAKVDSTEMMRLKAEEEAALALIAQQAAQEEKEQETMILIVVGNLAILLISLILFFILRKKKPKAK